jgi:hypothetical protein
MLDSFSPSEVNSTGRTESLRGTFEPVVSLRR